MSLVGDNPPIVTHPEGSRYSAITQLWTHKDTEVEDCMGSWIEQAEGDKMLGEEDRPRGQWMGTGEAL